MPDTADPAAAQAALDAQRAAQSQARQSQITLVDPSAEASTVGAKADKLRQDRPQFSDDKHLDEVLEALDEKYGIEDDPEVGDDPEAYLESLLEGDEEGEGEEAAEEQDEQPETDASEDSGGDGASPEESDTPSRSELLEALALLKGQGIQPGGLAGLSDAQIVQLAAGIEPAEGGEPQQQAEAVSEDAEIERRAGECQFVDQVTKAIEDEMGSEATGEVKKGLHSIAKQFAKQDILLGKLSDFAEHTLQFIGTQAASSVNPRVADDPALANQVVEEAMVLHQAGVRSGRFKPGLQGLQAAYKAAAKQIGVPDQTAAPRPTKAPRTPRPPSRRANASVTKKMGAEEFERRALLAAERGDKKAQDWLKQQREQGRVEVA